MKKYHISWKKIYRLRCKRAKALRKAWGKTYSNSLFIEMERNERLAKQALDKWALGDKCPLWKSEMKSTTLSSTSLKLLPNGTVDSEYYCREAYAQYKGNLSYEEYWRLSTVMRSN